MRKNGFTLVELLATIVLLTIILVIAVPSIAKIIINSRTNSYEAQKKLIEDTTKKYVVSNYDLFSNEIQQIGYKAIKLGDLIDSGLFIKDLVNPTTKMKIDRNTIICVIYRNGKYEYHYTGEVSYDCLNLLGGEYTPEVVYTEEYIDSLIESGYIPISSPSELNNIRTSTGNIFGVGTKWEGTYTGGLDKKYIQVKDIDMNIEPYNSGTNFNPIGVKGIAFKGEYDGAIYKISNLYIKQDATDYVGLFGYLIEATVKNLKLDNATIIGKQYVGAVAGYTYNSKIINIQVNANVTAESSDAGGVIGYLGRYSEAVGLYSEGNVEGENNTGGLIGEVRSANIRDSYSKSIVSGASYVGGLFGYIVRYDSYSSYSNIINCYAAGRVTGASNTGGLVGYISYVNAYNSYYDINATGQETSAIGAGKTTEEMQAMSTYSNWNFNAIWKRGTDGYPTFQDLTFLIMSHPIADTFFSGSGTETDPYIITTPEQLNKIRENLNAHYKLANDIDLIEASKWNRGRGFEPIRSTVKFKGSLDGDSFTISNLYMNYNETDYVGLFSDITTGSTIKNLNFDNAIVAGNQYVGTVVAYAYGSKINNIRVNGKVAANSTYAGGVVGYLGKFSNVTGLYSEGNIEGKDNLGGIIGEARSVTISDSYSKMNVSGTTNVGGLIGYINRRDANSSNSNMSYCYAIGEVAGTTNVGGLVGYASYTNDSSSYYDINTTSQETSARGTGKTTEEMKQQSTYEDWDFEETWGMNPSINNGYPYLINN